MIKTFFCILLISSNIFVLFIKKISHKIIFLFILDIFIILVANTIFKLGMANLILFLSFGIVNLFFYFDKTENFNLKLNNEIIYGIALNLILILFFYFSIKNNFGHLKNIFEMTAYQIYFSILLLIALFVVGYLILINNREENKNV